MTRAPEAVEPNLLDRPGQELERRTVRVNESLSLAYADRGQGDPVVLLHGTLTTLEDMMIPLSGPLGAERRVLAFDRPGCGRSTVRRWVDSGIWRQAERLWEALDALRVERPLLVGHSFGASVAIAMAMLRPDGVRGVVALAPLVRPEPRLEHALFSPRAPVGAGDWLGLGAGSTVDRALLPALWRAMFLPQRMPSAVADGFPFQLAGQSETCIRIGEDAAAAGPDLIRLMAEASSCTTPMRILGGDQDIVVRNGLNGRLLAALLPNGAYIDLPNMGHMAHHFLADQIAHVVDALASGAGATAAD